MTRNSRAAGVRMGVVGVGDFGARHAAVAAALPEIELVGVADHDGDRARAIGGRYGVPSFPDAASLLTGRRVDAVVIATPERHHLADLEVVLRAGVHALVEKPLVAGVAEADRVRELVRGSDRIVLPGHVSRFLPGFAALRERVRGQRVQALRAVRGVPRARLDLHGAGHPALVAMVHDLDLLHALVAAPLDDVSSVQRWTEPGRPHPQIVLAQLRFADGTVASVENHWTLPHERQYVDARLEVITDRETLTLATPGAGLRIGAADGDYLPDTELDTWVAGLPVGALATQMRHFGACVAASRPSEVVGVEDALWAVETASRIARQTPER